MQATPSVSTSQVLSFLDFLRHSLPDPRDTRGLRHSLEFPLVCVVLAMLSRCQTTSSIQRFIVERLDWLRLRDGNDTRAGAVALILAAVFESYQPGRSGRVGASIL